MTLLLCAVSGAWADPTYKSDFTDGQVIWTTAANVDAAITAGWMKMNSSLSKKDLKGKKLMDPSTNEEAAAAQYANTEYFYVQKTFSETASSDKSLYLYVKGIESITFYIYQNSDGDGTRVMTAYDGEGKSATSLGSATVPSGKRIAYFTVSGLDGSEQIIRLNASNELLLTAIKVGLPSGPKDGVFTISKSSLEVGETAKILLNGNDNFSTYFTATTLWEPVATGPYVSLTSDGTVTAVKNTPEGYYFTFTANSKDTEKYNTTTNNSITVAVTAPKCATPTIYPGDGGTFVGANSVTINTETEGASIYYTLDGTTPTSASALYDPADKPTITTTTTVKAIAVKADYDDSDVATAKITKVITSTVNDWNFTNWSDATKTGVQADATNWYNKEADGDGKLDFTTAGHIGRSNKNALENGALEYSGTAVAETDGLKFTAPATSMALMFDQPNTTIGTYNGNQYIWLYGKNSKIIIENVPAGATIRMGVETHKTDTGRGVDLSGSSGITLTEGVAKPTGYSNNEWSVPNGGDITVTPNVGGCHIYYITIKKNKEIENVSSFGWSTYITKTAVAFDANTAYVITNVKGSSITTEAVTSVPANTAVLLKDEGEKTIDPQTSASDPETNLLSVCNGTANGTKVPYVLAKDGASAGFKKWTGDIAKLNGRVVLWLDAEVAARDFFSLDETTGINKVESTKATENNQYYNLAGQRVAQPTKGLYIVNGKKVIIK